MEPAPFTVIPGVGNSPQIERQILSELTHTMLVVIKIVNPLVQALIGVVEKISVQKAITHFDHPVFYALHCLD